MSKILWLMALAFVMTVIVPEVATLDAVAVGRCPFGGAVGTVCGVADWGCRQAVGERCLQQ